MPKFDTVVHQPTRLAIVAALSAAREISFTYLRSQLQLTDGNLSRHLTVLENAGYIKITKKFVKKKPQTWIAITNTGQRALNSEITSLKMIIKQSKQ